LAKLNPLRAAFAKTNGKAFSSFPKFRASPSVPSPGMQACLEPPDSRPSRIVQSLFSHRKHVCPEAAAVLPDVGERQGILWWE
jgi:hypothetical protein